VTFTITVSSITTGIPTGTVTFFDGIRQLGTVGLDATGNASQIVSGFTIGRHEITVEYSGDLNFPSNTSALVIHYRSPRPRP
jgi:large repetitive protein